MFHWSNDFLTNKKFVVFSVLTAEKHCQNHKKYDVRYKLLHITRFIYEIARTLFEKCRVFNFWSKNIRHKNTKIEKVKSTIKVKLNTSTSLVCTQNGISKVIQPILS